MVISQQSANPDPQAKNGPEAHFRVTRMAVQTKKNEHKFKFKIFLFIDFLIYLHKIVIHSKNKSELTRTFTCTLTTTDLDMSSFVALCWEDTFFIALLAK